MSEQPIPESVPVDFADAFDDWIAGATISRRSVPIYGKPGLYAEFQQLERDLELAEALEEDGGEMAGSESARIRSRMNELYDEWMGSKSTWTVRALTSDEHDALAAADEEQGLAELVEPKRDPAPEPPTPLPERHTAQQAKTHTVEMTAYKAAKAEWDKDTAAHEKAMAEYADERNLRAIAASVERIEFADGRTKDGVTVDQIRTLRNRLGNRQVMSLLTAAFLASSEEPEIPAPFSRSNSTNDTTS